MNNVAIKNHQKYTIKFQRNTKPLQFEITDPWGITSTTTMSNIIITDLVSGKMQKLSQLRSADQRKYIENYKLTPFNIHVEKVNGQKIIIFAPYGLKGGVSWKRLGAMMLSGAQIVEGTVLLWTPAGLLGGVLLANGLSTGWQACKSSDDDFSLKEYGIQSVVGLSATFVTGGAAVAMGPGLAPSLVAASFGGATGKVVDNTLHGKKTSGAELGKVVLESAAAGGFGHVVPTIVEGLPGGTIEKLVYDSGEAIGKVTRVVMGAVSGGTASAASRMASNYVEDKEDITEGVGEAGVLGFIISGTVAAAQAELGTPKETHDRLKRAQNRMGKYRSQVLIIENQLNVLTAQGARYWVVNKDGSKCSVSSQAALQAIADGKNVEYKFPKDKEYRTFKPHARIDTGASQALQEAIQEDRPYRVNANRHVARVLGVNEVLKNKEQEEEQSQSSQPQLPQSQPSPNGSQLPPQSQSLQPQPSLSGSQQPLPLQPQSSSSMLQQPPVSSMPESSQSGALQQQRFMYGGPGVKLFFELNTTQQNQKQQPQNNHFSAPSQTGQNNPPSNIASQLPLLFFAPKPLHQFAYGCQERPMDFDVGDCLFTAAAAARNEGKDRTDHYRQLAVNYLRTYREQLIDYVDLSENSSVLQTVGCNNRGESITYKQPYFGYFKYCDLMAKPRVWGGPAELFALAHALETTIVVMLENKTTINGEHIYGYQHAHKNILYLGYVGSMDEGHYVPIDPPMDDPQANAERLECIQNGIREKVDNSNQINLNFD